jgi:hypothetical protein
MSAAMENNRYLKARDTKQPKKGKKALKKSKGPKVSKSPRSSSRMPKSSSDEKVEASTMEETDTSTWHKVQSWLTSFLGLNAY